MNLNQVIDKQKTLLQTIQEAYPNLEIRSARLHTGEGQFNDILFVNDDLIFRFPRYEDAIHDFVHELEFLQKLQGYLSLPIPNPIYVSSENRTIGKVFMGYKMLKGKPLFRDVLNKITDPAALDSLAHQLAEFLLGLHGISAAALGRDLPVKNRLAEYKTFFSELEGHLFPFMRPDARTSITEQFENYFGNTPVHDYVPSVIHGDFGGSNILFEADQITGVIDFSFAGLDDPAADLAAVSTYGDSFFAQICTYYSPDRSMLERARFYRSTFALYEALHGFRKNDKEAFESGMDQYV